MSIKVMAWVWENAQASGTDLLALLALADFANDEGKSIFPKMKTLAMKIRMSERQTRRIVHDLVQAGHLIQVREGGWNGKSNCTNEYAIPLGGTDKLSPPDTDDRGGTDMDVRGVMTMVSPHKPLVNHPLKTPLLAQAQPVQAKAKSAEPTGKAKEVSPHQAIVDAYVNAIKDYEDDPVINFGETAKAAKTIREHNHTPEEVTYCVGMLKADPWWQGKPLSLTTVAKQMGAILAKRAGKVGPKVAPTSKLDLIPDL
jgi:hypothetical protein